MPMDTLGASHPEEWQGAVLDRLSVADSAHVKANDGIVGGISAVRAANAEYARQRDAVTSNFAQKIQNTTELVQRLSTGIHSLQQTSKHCEWSLKQLQDAHQALSIPASICQKRMDLRTKLPKRERVHDAFFEALNREEREIEVAKSRLSAAITATQRTLEELALRQKELSDDLHDKQHGLVLDHACASKAARHPVAKAPLTLSLRFNDKGTPVKPVRVFSPSSTAPGTSMLGQESFGTEQERTRQKMTCQGADKAARSEAAARARCTESRALLEATMKGVDAAHRTSQAEMATTVEHTEVLRQELLKQQKATLVKIADLEKYLGLTSDKLQALEKPLTSNVNRDRIRSARTAREAISDPVSEALHTEQTALQAKKLQLQSETASMRQTMEELQRTAHDLAQDIEDKDKALAIHRACAGVKNPAHSNLSYGFAKVGAGQRHLSDTASSNLRQTPMGLKSASIPSTPRRSIGTPRMSTGSSRWQGS